jgi:hypothetical protein
VKVSDFIAFLAQFNPEQEILTADYYYDLLEGFSSVDATDLCKFIAPAEGVLLREHHGDVLLLDFNGLITS